MLREDTVISSFPPSFDRDEERTNHAGPRGRMVESRTDAAIQSLGDPVPPAPKGWGAQPADRRLQAVPPETMTGAVLIEEPRRPPAPPAPPARRPAGKQIIPIPEPCFEPSVVAQVPRPPAPAPQRQAPAVDAFGAPAPQTAGKVIVMFGCRGGGGATTLAVNTAASLARAGKTVCLVDLDLQLGDVFVALDMQPTSSISALAREASTIDASAIKRRMTRHDSGVYAITQTGHIDDVDPHLVERMPALMATLAGHFDYVIVDGVRDFGDCALAALDMADHVALVVTQDVASVRRAARAVGLFRRLGYSETKLRLVLNRVSRKARVDESDVVRALGLSISSRVRNDYKKATGCLDDGALIGDVARGSGIAKDLAALADSLAGSKLDRAATQGAAPQKKTGGLFGFLRRSGN